MRFGLSIVFLCFWKFTVSSASEKSIGVMLPANAVISRYNETATTVMNLFNVDVNVRWIQANRTQPSISGPLTDVWAKKDLVLLISLVDTCVTPLVLAASWNLPIFTSNCAEDPERLYDDRLYLTHIRLDPTWTVLAPRILSFLSSTLPNVDAVSVQLLTQEAASVAQDLRFSRWRASICEFCIPRTENEVLVILGTPQELIVTVGTHSKHHWRSIILVTKIAFSHSQAAELIASVSEPACEIYRIQPTPSAPTSQVEYLEQALSVYFRESTDRTRRLLSVLSSNCVDAGAEDQTCFNQRRWSLGNFEVSKYSNRSCQLKEKNDFYPSAKFSLGNNSWIIQMIACNSSSSLSAIGYQEKEDVVMQVLYAVIGLLLCVIVVGMAIFIWWRYRKNRLTSNYNKGKPTWQISSKDVVIFEYDENQQMQGETCSLYSQALPAFVTDSEKLDVDKEATTDFGYFKDQPVGIKKLMVKDYQLSKHQAKELEIMVGTHHENIAAFYGGCIKPTYIMLVTQYCIKGSLEEIFWFEPVHMDETFISSIVLDIVRGMKYLHKTSHIGVHGNLKSSNCLVTGRWVVKLSGFGLTELRSKYREDRDYLWCAPEVINKTQVASQKADVYSFAIILYEVIGKQGPFGKSYVYSEEQLEALIKRISEFGYHPETSWLCCEDYLKNIMLSCWQTPPKLRPDFNHLNNQLKPFRAIMNGRSIVDNMMVMMERYQMRLEDLVEEKTAQLQQEKRKTENLLHRMLPPQVADQLIAGRKVLPESYSCITVLISDICGFTALASTATPIQVIQLLNDLYTLFDSITKNFDVYKVETMGDAYLCVSGLPRPNGDRHAVEIALMALQFIESLQTFKVRHTTNAKEHLQMRIGIHSGRCVAGVVGVSMPRYTLFGDTINVASRLESSGEPMKIQISQQTKNLLDKQTNYFVCEKRGMVDIKGKGEMPTWWLKGTTTPVPSYKDYGQQLSVITDSLTLPGGRERNSSNASDLDLLKTPEASRSRSNSVKSQSSSSKSAQVFQRAGSFRHKIKSDSLSSSQVSEGNIAKLSVAGLPTLPPTTESHSVTSRLLPGPHVPSPNITIQVEEAS